MESGLETGNVAALESYRSCVSVPNWPNTLVLPFIVTRPQLLPLAPGVVGLM